MATQRNAFGGAGCEYYGAGSVYAGWGHHWRRASRATRERSIISSEDEWYKAAYYEPGGDTDDYWLYPTRSNSIPTEGTVNAFGEITNDVANIANYNRGADWNGQDGNLTTVGSGGAGSAGPYGAFDMAGNVFEWNEAVISGSFRGLRGGSWSASSSTCVPPAGFSTTPTSRTDDIGFRVASP